MTKFLLIRHGAHDLLGKVLAGRRPGVPLNASGQAQAASLHQRLGGSPLDALYSSPLQRTRETAEPLAAACGLEVRFEVAFQEIDFGAWTGLSFEELHPDAEWQLWNNQRTKARPPQGESMAEVQARFVAGLHTLASVHVGETVAIISHGDPIKAALFHVLGISLDLMPRLEISPASVSILQMDKDYCQVTLLNALGPLGETGPA